MSHTLDEERDMICSPDKWPMLVLPLKRSNNGLETAVLTAPLSVMKIPPAEPITIRIGTMFDNISELPTKTYQDVWALLDDGWRVD